MKRLANMVLVAVALVASSQATTAQTDMPMRAWNESEDAMMTIGSWDTSTWGQQWSYISHLGGFSRSGNHWISATLIIGERYIDMRTNCIVGDDINLGRENRDGCSGSQQGDSVNMSGSTQVSTAWANPCANVLVSGSYADEEYVCKDVGRYYTKIEHFMSVTSFNNRIFDYHYYEDTVIETVESVPYVVFN